tara:strand:+ start:919 stop:1155 length:237 start_codon:yes stop_codon:yes gene_type:complete
MPQKAKLVWNFSGPDALKIAEHHLIHLKEFSVLENILFIETGTEKVTDLAYDAFIIVDLKWANTLRTKLKPKQGYLVE